jgi:hypothetical protein
MAGEILGLLEGEIGYFVWGRGLIGGQFNVDGASDQISSSGSKEMVRVYWIRRQTSRLIDLCHHLHAQ